MAAVRVPVTQHPRGVGFEPIAYRPAHEHTAEWLVARRDALGESDQVGDDTKVLGAEPRAEAPEAADDLVEDQERASGVASGAQPFEIAGWRR